MREILFRAKAINRDEGYHRTRYKNGDWVYGLVTRLYDERFENSPASMRNTDGISGIDVDYKTIGEYTGLLDKNGRKIFEGDVVRCKNYHGEVDGIIQYHNLKWYLSCTSGYSDEYLWNCSGIEVIGNIYDNPELLGGFNEQNVD